MTVRTIITNGVLLTLEGPIHSTWLNSREDQVQTASECIGSEPVFA